MDYHTEHALLRALIYPILMFLLWGFARLLAGLISWTSLKVMHLFNPHYIPGPIYLRFFRLRE